MRILFAGGNGWLPEATGGTQNSTQHLISQASARGHACGVYCALVGRSAFGVRMRAQRKLTRRTFSLDTTLGYPVLRTWDPFDAGTVADAVARFTPDIVVIQTTGAVPLARAVRALGVPMVIYLRNVEFDELGGDLSSITGARYIANSRFTADAYRKRFGISANVIPPTIDAESYRVDGPKDHATLINIHPLKGYAVARDMARFCPDIPFLFVEGWALDADQKRRTLAEIDALPNATFQARTPDMSQIYGRTRVLIAPSQWEEAWGRVASEAQCSGIPVIGSDRGGLPEAIGPGGVILPHDAPTAEWTAVLRRVWSDNEFYAELSDAASVHAERPELDTAQQVSTFLAELNAAVQTSDGTSSHAAE